MNPLSSGYRYPEVVRQEQATACWLFLLKREEEEEEEEEKEEEEEEEMEEEAVKEEVEEEEEGEEEEGVNKQPFFSPLEGTGNRDLPTDDDPHNLTEHLEERSLHGLLKLATILLCNFLPACHMTSTCMSHDEYMHVT